MRVRPRRRGPVSAGRRVDALALASSPHGARRRDCGGVGRSWRWWRPPRPATRSASLTGSHTWSAPIGCGSTTSWCRQALRCNQSGWVSVKAGTPADHRRPCIATLSTLAPGRSVDWWSMNLVGRTERRGRDEARCRCGHPRAVHLHYRRGLDCAVCGPSACPRYRRRRWRRRRSDR
jgi:hypothetical protein